MEINEVADRSASRFINQKAIANLIFVRDGISRTEIAKELGISKPTVASIVEHLMKIGLVEERGTKEAAKSGGRKPIMLYFNSQYRFIGALDLSPKDPICAVADLFCRVVGISRINIKKGASAKKCQQAIKDTFQKICSECKISNEQLEIILVSHPGILDEEEARSINNPHDRWMGINIENYLKKEFGTWVIVKKDVNVAAIGEMTFGINYGVKDQKEDLIYVSCGLGISAGIVVNKKLYERAAKAESKIGFLLMPDGRTLEEHVAMESLVRRVEEADRLNKRKKETVTFDRIVERLYASEAIVSKIVYEIGQQIGREIVNLSIVFNIPTVIVGGDYQMLGKTFFHGIHDMVQKSPLMKPDVIMSDLQETSGIYGCLAIGQENLMDYLVTL